MQERKAQYSLRSILHPKWFTNTVARSDDFSDSSANQIIGCSSDDLSCIASSPQVSSCGVLSPCGTAQACVQGLLWPL